MTRMRLLGLALVGVLAASVLLSAGAGARRASTNHAAATSEYNLKMLPELGRCIKTGRGGEYRGSRCIRSEPGSGTFSWLSGPGPKPKFTGVIKEPIELKLKGAGPNAATACKAATLTGEYTGPKNMKIATIVFTGCVSGEGECQNKAGSTMGEITAEVALNGQLGFISHPKKLKVGWDLTPASGSNLLSFECGAKSALGKSVGGGATREVQGSVIGKVEPIGHMTSEFGLTQSVNPKTGGQNPERFEGGVTDTLSTILGEKLPGAGKATLASLFVGSDRFKNEEALEVLGRCTGSGC